MTNFTLLLKEKNFKKVYEITICIVFRILFLTVSYLLHSFPYLIFGFEEVMDSAWKKEFVADFDHIYWKQMLHCTKNEVFH